MDISISAVFILALLAWIALIKGKALWCLILGVFIGATATILHPIIAAFIGGVASMGG